MKQYRGRKARKWFFLKKLAGASTVGMLSIALALLCSAHARASDPFAAAMGFLAKEKSLAESNVSILKTFGRDDVKNYANGIRLYANAKAEFDGLIAKLKVSLETGKSLNESDVFKAGLDQAAEQRIAFTGFVFKEIIADDPGRKNPLAIASIAAVPDLIEALTEAGHTIWKEYRNAKKEQRQEIMDRLDEMRWRNFSDIVGSG